MDARQASLTSQRLVLGAFIACSVLTGCALSPLAKHTVAFADATTVVTGRSEDAYRMANQVYFEEQVATAARDYDSDPHWDPHSIQPLLTKSQVQVRIEVLEALKAYALLLAQIEASSKSPALDSAAAGAGSGLLALGKGVNSNLGGGTKLSLPEINAFSTAVNVLGSFLIARAVRRKLPAVLEKLDPQIDTLCHILRLDLSTLNAQTQDDYSNLITQEDSFVRGPGRSLNPVEKRAEIERMPILVQRSQAARDLFDQLDLALVRLAEAHHALTAAAKEKNSLVLRARIADLTASSASLSQVYGTLPTK